jgi:ComF family protein
VDHHWRSSSDEYNTRVQSGLANALTTLGREALRIVLPSWCVGCRRDLPWRDRTASCCASCWSALPKITSAKCTSCALPSEVEGESFLCVECRVEPLPVAWCDAWGEYRGSLERVLHALKFERHDFLADPLAGLVEETLRDRGDLAFDALVPVPMSRAKERRRGYNQAERIARALAPRLDIDCRPGMLVRTAERATQSTLPKRERAANVRGAFAATPAANDLSLLLIDDICTTGETLRACAAALLRQGAKRVCAVAVAKAK